MKLIILGAGGHGQVVADLARQTGRYEEVLFLDDRAEGSEVVGTCADYVRFQNQDVRIIRLSEITQGVSSGRTKSWMQELPWLQSYILLPM